MPPTGNQVIKQLERAGWIAVRQRGSHVRLTSADGRSHVTVPAGKSDLKAGLLCALEKQTGVTFE